MTTKPRLTEEEHSDIGRTLAAMQRQLTHLHAKLENAYPRQGPESKPARKVGAAAESLEAARYELENALSRDHPESGTDVYFPKA